MNPVRSTSYILPPLLQTDSSSGFARLFKPLHGQRTLVVNVLGVVDDCKKCSALIRFGDHISSWVVYIHLDVDFKCAEGCASALKQAPPIAYFGGLATLD